MRVSRRDIFYLLHKCYDAVNERKQKNDSIHNRKIPSAASITRA
ncbi:unknown [Firmicutes bacterium CAG:791]|nr:unknown [Firmicutes bacterium CAG:791]